MVLSMEPVAQPQIIVLVATTTYDPDHRKYTGTNPLILLQYAIMM
jgi:hypothetical protein